jgi:hypothetical protein
VTSGLAAFCPHGEGSGLRQAQRLPARTGQCRSACLLSRTKLRLENMEYLHSNVRRKYETKAEDKGGAESSYGYCRASSIASTDLPIRSETRIPVPTAQTAPGHKPGFQVGHNVNCNTEPT